MCKRFYYFRGNKFITNKEKVFIYLNENQSLNFMKKSGILLVLLFFLSLSCTRNSKQNLIDLRIPWKFRTGDNPEWAKPEMNDSAWYNILPELIWEQQGYKGYDGYAWYRLKIIIPSSLKNHAYIKDSLQFRFGKIDDCDQVFLNGEMIGENGQTVPQKYSAGDDFIKTQGKWNMNRRYILAANDPRIRWDKENVIAIRVFDQDGPGGLFDKPYFISMVELQDYLQFNYDNYSFNFYGDTMVGRKFEIRNLSVKNDFNGKLMLEVWQPDKNYLIYSMDTAVILSKNSKNAFEFRFRTDISKPCRAMITFLESQSGQEVKSKIEIPYILTPKLSKEPRINGARVFGVRRGSPFLFKVPATGSLPLHYSAENLPQGLKLDEQTGIITGFLRKKGNYSLKLKVENSIGIAVRDFTIVVGNLLSLTPPMGWNSWNCWGLSVSETKVRQSAESMKNSGLIDHGWTYINIDDGWEDKHNEKGKILTNPRFPNMEGLCEDLHGMGLKVGIYSSPGPKTCGGYEGSFTFEDEDAQTYASWGIDYLKYDWCSYGSIAPKPPSSDDLKHPYKAMEHALRKANRDIHYSLCQYGMGEVWEWGTEVNGNSWRTTGDIEDTWESMSGIGFSQDSCAAYAGPGRWNDPDMLVVGWVGWGPSLHYTRLTSDEQYTHISLWCLLASPLLIGCDLSRLDPFTMNLLTNDEVLAVNQDPMGKQARRIKKGDGYEIWVKEMQDGSFAAGLFNLTEKNLYIPVGMSDIPLMGIWNLRDLWSQTDLGKVRNHFEMKVFPHGAKLIRLSI